MSTVAIVMTTYNGEKYAGEQIESILASSYQDFELFIYDDGSKDDTMAVLRSYEQQKPSMVHVFQNENNLGVTLNFLQATARTTMDYVMFCDQDDVWKPDKIAVTLKRMRHMEAQLGKASPLAVFTDTVIADQNLNVISGSFFCSNHLNPRKTDLPHILMENKLIGCTVMVNCALRKVLQSHRLPEQAKFHDWWIALIAASMGKIGFVNEGTLLYRQHGGNVVGGNGFLPYVRNRIEDFKDQKEALHILYRQADEFVTIYDELLSDDSKQMINTFAHMEEYPFIKKRMILLHNGYLKTGIIRNFGLMIIV
ncbi:MAG TPA: glycosyltransferase family 2 protein [Mobilitalea sp.]|nr:glycosyltransferase family 2 protein [Mobilitalea sp.]